MRAEIVSCENHPELAGTKYPSLKEAVDKVNGTASADKAIGRAFTVGASVKMIKDSLETSGVTVNGDVHALKLDLSGKTVTLSVGNRITVQSGTALSVTDGSAPQFTEDLGTISASGVCAFKIEASGSLTLENGHVICDEEAFEVAAGASLYVKGGFVNTTGSAEFAEVIKVAEGSKIKISGGWFRHKVCDIILVIDFPDHFYTVTTIEDGYKATDFIVNAPEEATPYTVVKAENKITVSYKSNDGSETYFTKEHYLPQGATARIPITSEEPKKEGCEFKGWAEEKNAKEAKYHAGDTVDLKEDKSFYAVFDDAVAKIKETGTYYFSLQDALDAALTGQTVVLLKDITVKDSQKVVSKDITLDYTAHDITGTMEEDGGLFVLSGVGAGLTLSDSTGQGTPDDNRTNGAVISIDKGAIFAGTGTITVTAGNYFYSTTDVVPEENSLTMSIRREGTYSTDVKKHCHVKYMTEAYQAGGVTRYIIVDGPYFYAQSVEIEGLLLLNYYVVFPDAMIAGKMNEFGVKFTYPDGSSELVALNTVTRASTGQYKFTAMGVVLKDISENVKAEIVKLSGGSPVYTYAVKDDYCIEKYYYNMHDKSTDGFKPVTVAALNTSAWAQKYFMGWEDSRLANRNLTAEEKAQAVDDGNIDESWKAIYDEGEKSACLIDDVQAELILTNGTTAKIFLKTSGDDGSYSFTLDGTPVVPSEEAGMKSFAVSDIAGKRLSDVHVLKAKYGEKTFTLKYTALSWAYKVVHMPDESDISKNFAKSLGAYCRSAYTYFKYEPKK